MVAVPRISIVVPCYNQAQYLDECLQSVLDQSYQNWECIIVNDGSPDNTEEVAIRWIEKDVRFKYLNKENGGLSSARNFGIERAIGEWILPLDADDKIGDQYLQLASDDFEMCDIIYCEAEFFGTVNGKWFLPPYNFHQELLGNVIFCSAFFQKHAWAKCGGYDEKMKRGREDWEFWVRMISPSTIVKKLNYNGFYYRRKDNSMDVKVNSDKALSNELDSYVFNKNLQKYRTYFPYNIFSIRKNFEANIISDFYQNQVSKNIFSKFLFSLINRL